MKIYTTTDCIDLNPFEKMLLLVIKGAIQDAWQQSTIKRKDDKITIITVSKIDSDKFINNIAGNMPCVQFKIANAHPGLFKEVERTIKPFIGNLKVYGGCPEYLANGDEGTVIILQRFELKRQQTHLDCYQCLLQVE